MQKEWASIPGATQNLTADATFLPSGFTPGVSGMVLRMIGEYQVASTGGGTIGAIDVCQVGVGIGVVSTDGFTAGAVSDPISESDFPWLYWANHVLQFTVAIADQNHPNANIRIPYDIRSMRKMKPRETLVFVFEYGDIFGAPPLSFGQGLTRVLFAR